jgi:hypothetical protein
MKVVTEKIFIHFSLLGVSFSVLAMFCGACCGQHRFASGRDGAYTDQYWMNGAVRSPTAPRVTWLNVSHSAGDNC